MIRGPVSCPEITGHMVELAFQPGACQVETNPHNISQTLTETKCNDQSLHKKTQFQLRSGENITNLHI